MSTTRKHDYAELPDGWRMVRLGDVAEVNPRRPLLDCEPKDAVTFLPMSSIAEGLGDIDEREQRPFEDVAKGYAYFEENDVLFAKITPCLQNGKHALATGLLGQFGFGTTEFHVVRAGSAVDNRFLFKTLTRPMNIEKCVRSFTGTAGQQRVQPEVLRALQMSLSPLLEQRAIADVLDSIDDAIERPEAVIAATETLRDSLLHELLTRGVPGWHTKWKDVPGIGTIPAGWEVVRLGEVIPKFEYGTSVQCNSDPTGVPVLRIPNIASAELDLTELKYANLSTADTEKLRLAAGDILVVRTNGNPEICGQSWVTDGLEGDWAFASYLVRGRPDQSRVNPEFAGHFMRSEAGRRSLRGHIRTSAGNYNLSVGDLGSMPFPCPALVDQEYIVQSVGSSPKLIDGLRDELGRLTAAKRSSAVALLSGREWTRQRWLHPKPCRDMGDLPVCQTA